MRNRLISIILSAFMLFAMCSCSFENIIDFENSDGYFGSDFSPELTVHFLDVGQGDSIFIELPNDETMLIDSGENYHGEGIINYIQNSGYSKIDYLVATHPHSDHIGSMSYIVRHFDIGSMYMPKVSANTKTYENLLDSVLDKGLKVKNGKSGVNIVQTEDFSADIIAPVTIDENELNNSSIMIKLVYDNVSFLFTGDAEKEEISTLTSDITADVLKVGHHGSRTSTTDDFLEAVSPQIAVISCGEDNDYGHPHDSTLSLLENFGCEVYRTDEDKTVIVGTDGETIKVKTGGTTIERAK